MKSKYLIVFLVIFIPLFYCEKKQPSRSINMEDRSEIIAKTREYVLSVSSQPFQPLHYSVLDEFLPREYDGVESENRDAKTVSVYNLKSSYAHAEYSLKDEASIEIDIIDFAGNTRHPAFISFKMLSLSGVEEEGINGYRKLVEIAGLPGFREYDSRNKKTVLTVLAGERIIIRVSSLKLEPEEVDRFLKKIDLKQLSEV